MTQIPPSPKGAMQHSQPLTQSKPIAQTTPSTTTKPPKYQVIQTFRGTKGIKKNHVIDVMDMTTDNSQKFDYLDHCRTCAWEGRFDTLDEAVNAAKTHVGI